MAIICINIVPKAYNDLLNNILTESIHEEEIDP